MTDSTPKNTKVFRSSFLPTPAHTLIVLGCGKLIDERNSSCIHPEKLFNVVMIHSSDSRSDGSQRRATISSSVTIRLSKIVAVFSAHLPTSVAIKSNCGVRIKIAASILIFMSSDELIAALETPDTRLRSILKSRRTKLHPKTKLRIWKPTFSIEGEYQLNNEISSLSLHGTVPNIPRGEFGVFAVSSVYIHSYLLCGVHRSRAWWASEIVE